MKKFKFRPFPMLVVFAEREWQGDLPGNFPIIFACPERHYRRTFAIYGQPLWQLAQQHPHARAWVGQRACRAISSMAPSQLAERKMRVCASSMGSGRRTTIECCLQGLLTDPYQTPQQVSETALMALSSAPLELYSKKKEI